MSGKVYIILVNWNGANDTLECLESVLRLDYENFQIIVCDNDSNDDSVVKLIDWARGHGSSIEAQNPALNHLVQPNIAKPLPIDVLSRGQAEDSSLARSAARIVIIRTGANLGFAGANNVGMRYGALAGDAAYFWLLNNDTVVEPFALSALVERTREVHDRGVVGSTLVFYHRPHALQAMGVFSYSPAKARGIPLGAFRAPDSVTVCDQEYAESVASYVVGASMLVPCCFYLEVGGMCEDYFLYFEEIDWALRGAQFGFTCLYAARSIVFHKVGSSTSKGTAKKFGSSARVAYRNRIKFTLKFYPEKIASVRCRIVVDAFRAILSGDWDEFWFALRVGLLGVRGN